MKNILIISPDITNGTSFYRCMGPFAHLGKTRRDFNFIYETDINWTTIARADLVFLQRPHVEAHLMIAQMAVDQNVPLWVDYDDDLLNVPESNPNFEEYAKPKSKLVVLSFYRGANIITVSTRDLKDKIDPYRLQYKMDYCKLVPNALNELIFTKTKKREDRKPVVYWRGSATHEKDLLQFLEPIKKLIQEFHWADFVFVGNTGWNFREQISHHKNVKFIPDTNIFKFFQTIEGLRPMVSLVPLWDCPLNRAKSNIAWIEATYVGAATVAPSWPEWQRKGIYNYSDQFDFFDVASRCINEANTEKDSWPESWSDVGENFTLFQVNKLREEIIDSLI